VFERNCGATSDYSTNLSLREATDAFDPDDQPPVLVVEGQVDLAPAWASEESLTVALFPVLETFTKQDRWGQIQIVYK
jgi:hypothetical protein